MYSASLSPRWPPSWRPPLVEVQKSHFSHILVEKQKNNFVFHVYYFLFIKSKQEIIHACRSREASPIQSSLRLGPKEKPNLALKAARIFSLTCSTVSQLRALTSRGSLTSPSLPTANSTFSFCRHRAERAWCPWGFTHTEREKKEGKKRAVVEGQPWLLLFAFFFFFHSHTVALKRHLLRSAIVLPLTRTNGRHKNCGSLWHLINVS